MTSPWEDGRSDAKICVLAQAPARTEMRMGRPLVGPSGTVFTECLHVAGLHRANLYILNIWPFCVDTDKRTGDITYQGEMLWHHTKGMTQTGWDLAAGQMKKLKECGAYVVLSLGQQAQDVLMGAKKPIMKWRGSPLWSERFSKKFIPTIHPAATIHGTYVWRYLIINDMKKLEHETASPALVPSQRDLETAPSMARIRGWIQDCVEAERVATDLEVINHQVSCFSLSYDKGSALTVPLLDERGNHYWTDQEEADIWLMYAALMGDPKVAKINQNIIGFDAPFLLDRMNIHTRGFIGDTMIAQHIMYPDFNKGLDFIASLHTREPYWKDDGKVWKNPDIPWETFQKYCGRDACVALESWDVLSGEMTAGGYWPTYERTVRLAGPLAYMMTRGLAVDRKGLADTKVRLDTEIAIKERSLWDLAGFELNVQSPKQCKEYFYGTLGLKPYTNRTGGVSTDDKAMARIVRKAGPGHKEAKLVQEIRALKKLKGTYIEVELDTDDRLRCSWNPRGTWTGRLSSSQTLRGTGMNLQNLHPEFKGFIVAG